MHRLTQRVPSADSRSSLTECVAIAATTRVARLSKPSSVASTVRGLGLPAEQGSLYELALTHRSYAFEQPEPTAHNERLEFLGDAILEAIVTDLIYHRYPDLPEGHMARLRAAVVNMNALADLAADLGLGTHIRLGRGEEASGGREKPSLLADTFEALVGALYVDRGLDAVSETLTPLFESLVARAREEGGHDTKGALQEAVARDRGGRPIYRVASTGPDHDKRFIAHVYVDEELRGVGVGKSKREAELAAAREALARLDGEGAGPRSLHEDGGDARAS